MEGEDESDSEAEEETKEASDGEESSPDHEGHGAPGRSGSGGGDEHERVPSTIPEEASAPLTESASFVLDERIPNAAANADADADSAGRERDDDLSALPAYQAYLYVLLGAAVARDFLHPRATASAAAKKASNKTEAELAVEREHKRILLNSEVREKGMLMYEYRREFEC